MGLKRVGFPWKNLAQGKDSFRCRWVKLSSMLKNRETLQLKKMESIRLRPALNKHSKPRLKFLRNASESSGSGWRSLRGKQCLRNWRSRLSGKAQMAARALGFHGSGDTQSK